MPPVFALDLRHPGDGVRIPDSPILDPAQDVTVEAWIRPATADNGGSFHFIVSKNYGGTGYALLLIGRGDDVRLQFEARDIVAYPMKMSVLANHWWHVAGVLRAHRDISLFLNGVQVASHPTNLDLVPNNLPLYIGTSPWDSFCGQLGEVRIWGVARTQEQILGSMAARRGSEGLIGDWRFGVVSRGRTYDDTHHTRPGEVLGRPLRVRARAIPRPAG